MYGFKTSIDGKFDDVLPRVTEELKKEGFGILSDIEAQILDYLHLVREHEQVGEEVD